MYNQDYYQKHKDRLKKKGQINWKIRKKLYPWYDSFRAARKRCNNPNDKDYKYYGGKGIEFNLNHEDGKFLWFRDKAYLMEKPSIDREDNEGNYTRDNCRFIEQSENTARAHNKQIIQLDLNGNIINYFNSIIEASRRLKISRNSIAEVCNGKQVSYKNFMWRYRI